MLVGDTHDGGIGPAVGNSLGVFRVLHASLNLEEGGDRRGELVVLDGAKATAGEVLAAVAKFPADDKGDDAVVCYVASHGAYDERKGGTDPTNGHFFRLPGGNLMRADLWRALRPEKRRLTVLITDTCNVPFQANPVAGGVPDQLPPGFENVDKPKWRLARALFVRPSGIVDLSGRSKDQFGWFQGPVHGGWFTYNFVNAFCDPPFKNADALDWPEFVQAVTERTSEFYRVHRKEQLAGTRLDPVSRKQLAGQQDQRPQFFPPPVGAGRGPFGRVLHPQRLEREVTRLPHDRGQPGRRPPAGLRAQPPDQPDVEVRGGFPGRVPTAEPLVREGDGQRLGRGQPQRLEGSWLPVEQPDQSALGRRTGGTQCVPLPKPLHAEVPDAPRHRRRWQKG
ncbi:MAG: caspase family protein [Gemmataceae bacterium]|nr:caspase family protein [Gemmataceae bacterium]